ncbi:MAG TPA: sigma-70 family RNA polymerase sigma factor [Polyangiaceae bacterium]|nr:sigma-70 family RNA polymerase sigma factor [Polyangiaceae bacterium]
MPEAKLTFEDVFPSHDGFVRRALKSLGLGRSDLDDVRQEVLLVVLRRLESFDHERELGAWLYAICLRVAAAHRRRAYVWRELPMADARRALQGSAPAPDEEAERRRTLLEAYSALQTLKEEHRVVFEMFELEGADCEGISAALSVPLGTVYSRLHYARRHFASRLRRLRFTTNAREPPSRPRAGPSRRRR